MTAASLPSAGEIALLPCPFCGGDELSHGWGYAGVHYGQVECHADGCGAAVFADTESEAIERWNARAPRIVTPEEVEKAAEAIYNLNRYDNLIGDVPWCDIGDKHIYRSDARAVIASLDLGIGEGKDG